MRPAIAVTSNASSAWVRVAAAQTAGTCVASIVTTSAGVASAGRQSFSSAPTNAVARHPLETLDHASLHARLCDLSSVETTEEYVAGARLLLGGDDGGNGDGDLARNHLETLMVPRLRDWSTQLVRLLWHGLHGRIVADAVNSQDEAALVMTALRDAGEVARSDLLRAFPPNPISVAGDGMTTKSNLSADRALPLPDDWKPVLLWRGVRGGGERGGRERDNGERERGWQLRVASGDTLATPQV